MSNLQTIVKWIIDNWFEISGAIGMIVTGASIIVKLTPTLKDDNAFLPIVKFIAKFIALNTNAPDERPK